MTEKKFHIPSIVIAAAAVVLEILAFILEGFIAAVIALIYCAFKKDTHRTKIGVVLSIIAIILAVAGFSLFMFILSRTGFENVETGYWFVDLFVKS